MSLIAQSELLKACERIAAKEATSFKYTARTKTQWRARTDQTLESPLPIETKPVIPAVETEIESDDDGVTAKTKVSGKTVCDCGHWRSVHCLGNPRWHTPEGKPFFWCITEHCLAGGAVACECEAFRTSHNQIPKIKRHKAHDYTPCADPACGHWKIDHCIKQKPGKAQRIEAHELAYRIVSRPDGTAYGCKHFDPENSACQCDSTSCSATADDKDFCTCERFKTPFAKPKPASQAKARKNKRNVEVQLKLWKTPATV